MPPHFVASLQECATTAINREVVCTCSKYRTCGSYATSRERDKWKIAPRIYEHFDRYHYGSNKGQLNPRLIVIATAKITSAIRIVAFTEEALTLSILRLTYKGVFLLSLKTVKGGNLG